jgi:uncharacterized protein YabE (DUF348 family)
MESAPTSGVHQERPRHRARRVWIIVGASVLALATVVAGTFTALAKTVTITVDGASRQVTTLSGTVGGALRTAGISLSQHDDIAPSPSSGIGDGSKIVLDRGKQITVTVDGAQRGLWTTATTVQDVLAAADVTVGQHDTVAPAASATIADGQTVLVERGRQVTLTLDGQVRTFWTTASTVGGALAQLGRSAGDLRLSADRSRPIPLNGLSVSATTLHTVHLVDGVAKARILSTPAQTVGDVLREAGKSLGVIDTVTPTVSSPVRDGMSIVIVRRTTTTLVKTVRLPQPATVTVKDPTTDTGTKRVLKGHGGTQLVTSKATLVNGKVTTTKVVRRTTVTKPVATRIQVGTRPLLDWRGGRVFFHDTSFGVNWDGLAFCESTNTPTAINANPSAGLPTYGLFQFDLPTWRSVGGSGNPINASPQEQLMRAKLLYQQRGLQPWACAYAAR